MERNRTKRMVAIAAALALAVGTLWVTTASGKNAKRQARLTGEKEVTAEGVANQGDLDGAGSASVRIKEGEVCFDVRWRDIDQPTMAHIHEAAADTTGPVVVTLWGSAVPANIHRVMGCTIQFDTAASGDADAATLLADIKANPSNYYVNLHNGSFPGGALRGQLRRSR